jgi:pre-mRNA-processing factor 8
MSERVQLLLSDRILGMTLAPEGRIWNYGIGLTQLWVPSISYPMTLDTPLLFWAEDHRPAAFLTVRDPLFHTCYGADQVSLLQFAAMDGEDSADVENSFA